jgi:hypothetical protein
LFAALIVLIAQSHFLDRHVRECRSELAKLEGSIDALEKRTESADKLSRFKEELARTVFESALLNSDNNTGVKGKE